VVRKNFTDRILLHDEPGEVEFVLDGETNLQDWPAQECGRGIMIVEPKMFGYLFVAEDQIGSIEDLIFVSRSIDAKETSKYPTTRNRLA
jgi:hypothetical protein